MGDILRITLVILTIGATTVYSNSNIYGPWQKWSTCSPKNGNCGPGTQWRFRDCLDWFSYLCYNTFETRGCTKPCKVDGKWSSWSPWGACSVTCGGGSQSRTRTCTNPAPANGGKDCRGNSTQTQKCGTRHCCKTGQHIYDKCGHRCVCSSSGTLTKCTRIRKEFTSMTADERERYIKVIKIASNDTRYKKRYDDLITLHKTIFFTGIHLQEHFLSWHRWFMLQYENLLREIDCRFTISYWDWSVVSGKPWGTNSTTDVWHSGKGGFGGDGVAPTQCVKTGPFKEGSWELVPSAAPPSCLKRRFNRIPPDSVAVALVLDIPPPNFVGFELALRVNLHNSVHCMIHGTMCSLDSASAPEFFLHHGMVDKIWEDWQKRSTAHRKAFFHGLNSTMPGTNGLLPRLFIDSAALPGGVRVEYAPVNKPVQSRVVSRLRALRTQVLRRIPREGFSSFGPSSIRLFKVSKREQEEAKKIDKMLQPVVRSVPPKSASNVDKQLGFKHKILSHM